MNKDAFYLAFYIEYQTLFSLEGRSLFDMQEYWDNAWMSYGYTSQPSPATSVWST